MKCMSCLHPYFESSTKILPPPEMDSSFGRWFAFVEKMYTLKKTNCLLDPTEVVDFLASNYKLPRSTEVIIDGNIGSGKSTLIDLYKNDTCFIVLPEPLNIWLLTMIHFVDYPPMNILDAYYSCANCSVGCSNLNFVVLFQFYAFFSRVYMISKTTCPDDKILLMERHPLSDM